MLVFDTETWLIAPGRLAPRLVCVTAQGDASPVQIFGRLDDWKTPVAAALESDVVVGHNVAYDLAVLATEAPDLVPLIWKAYDDGRVGDTLIRAQLIAIALGRFKFDPTIPNSKGELGAVPTWSLAGLAERFLGETVTGKDGPDVWRLRYRELDDVPVDRWPEEARRYALNDAAITRRVWNRLADYARSCAVPMVGAWIPDEVAQTRAAWALHLAGAWGIRTDAKSVDVLEASLTTTVEAARKVSQAAGLVRADGTRDMAAIRARVAKAYGDATATTAKGAIKTSTTVLAESGDAALVAMSEATVFEKRLTTFVPTLRAGVEGVINPRWRTLVESGRVSCTKPNLTFQPREGGVRECYRPRAGYYFAAADYDAGELCTLAQTCVTWFGASSLADAINAGRDPHLFMAAAILGITYDEAATRRAAKDHAVGDARQLAKAANFGFPGGLGAETLVDFAFATYGIVMTIDEAVHLKEVFRSTYPEIALYWERINGWMRQGGGSFAAALPFSGRVRGDMGYNNGCNYFFQGSVADGAKAAFFRLWQESQTRATSPFYGSKPTILMHDEIVAEVPIGRASAAADRLSVVMVEALSEVCPDVKITADPVLMRRWYKDAKTVRDDLGRLLPWSPT